MDTDKRIVRVPLAAELIHRMDVLVSNRTAGYETRADFIRDAIEALVLELSYPPAPPERLGPKEEGLVDAHVQHREGAAGPYVESSRDVQVPDMAITRLKAPQQVSFADQQGAQVEDDVLFGLHNRDYPSLWVAYNLAHATVDSLVHAEAFIEAVVKRAWSFAELIRNLDSTGTMKLTAMFPTNRSKPQSAAQGFRTFAVGGFSTRDNSLTAWGALFQWNLCQLQRNGQDVLLGLTREGFELLGALSGISLDLPHGRRFAEVFFAHLKRYAQADWRALHDIIELVAHGCSRTELIRRLLSEQPAWTEAQAATHVAGYISRSREWGLVEPKQIRGNYVLTDFGKELLEEC